MSGLTVEQMQFLADKGMSLADAIEFARMFDKPRSANAERQARYRRRRKGDDEGNVTRNVTDNADSNVTPSLSPAPSSFPQTPNQHPHPHTHPDNTPARKGRGSKLQPPAKPDGVKDQTWADFLDLRARKRADVTATAVDGLRREASKAGWTLEEALTETVTQGWQGFRADWVKERGLSPPGRASPQTVSHLEHYLAKQSGAQR